MVSVCTKGDLFGFFYRQKDVDVFLDNTRNKFVGFQLRGSVPHIPNNVFLDKFFLVGCRANLFVSSPRKSFQSQKIVL